MLSGAARRSSTGSNAVLPSAPPSPRGSSSSTQQLSSQPDKLLPSTIILPGPGADGCGAPGASYSYPQFPSRLRKEWMAIPPSALSPVLVDITSRRRKCIKKGNRMILARSVSEGVKDWQVRA